MQGSDSSRSSTPEPRKISWCGNADSALALVKVRKITFTIGICIVRLSMKLCSPPSLIALMLCIAPHLLRAQPQAAPAPTVPAWAQPGSATHTQVAPPADFHRPSKTPYAPTRPFEAQSTLRPPPVTRTATH